MNAGKMIELTLAKADRWRKSETSLPDQQIIVLRKLLKGALRTEFGNRYDFREILRSSDLISSFQNKIPFHTYEQIYSNWWYRVLAGERNITWKGKAKYFALSSGTSNASSKRIPITKSMFKMLRKAAFQLFTTLPDYHFPQEVYTKSWLAIGGTSRLEKINGHYEGYLSGINAQRRPLWTRAFYRPGDKIAQILDFDLRTDHIATQAMDWDVGLIIGIPHWVQLTLERIIKTNKIERINEIWPNLRGFISGGVDHRPYVESINKLVGHPLQYINTYLASEGLIAYQDHPNDQDLKLNLDGGIFYEFLPMNGNHFDDDGDLIGTPKALSIDEVKAGQNYAMVISTCAGAWRYLLGDIIRFTDCEKGRIVVSGRTKYYINLCTEHLTGDNMTAAISQTEEDLNIVIQEYMIAPMIQGNVFKHHWYVGLDKKCDATIVRDRIDQHLKRINDDYRSERNTVLSMGLEIVPSDLFYKWQKTKSAAGQSKVPRVIRGENLKSWQTFLAQNKPNLMMANQ